jgi:hypothetical protein
MEKVLLIMFLKYSGELEEARAILNLMEIQNKLKEYESQTFKKYFDTVLNS